MITRAIKNSFAHARQRQWEKTYWAFDLHNTIIKPNYSRVEIPREFYPMALEVMQLISSRKDVVRIMYTCSHPHEIQNYLDFFGENGIHFNYVNENPEIGSEGYGFYEQKPYFNVLFEDKAGFDPLEDWEAVKAMLSDYPESYLLDTTHSSL